MTAIASVIALSVVVFGPTGAAKGGPHRSPGLEGLSSCVIGETGPRLSHLLVRTNNLQPTTLAGVDHETKAVQLYDRGHQMQAKAHTRRTSDLVGAVEAPQHSLALLLTDAGSGIGHAHDGFAFAPQQLDIHLPAFGRK